MVKTARPRVAILGNCVAERLQGMLPRCNGFRERYEQVRLPVMHLQKSPREWRDTAKAALSCELIFTQPLFSYGPCNTAELRAALRPGQSLAVFSSPQFDGYFPDLITLDRGGDYRLRPILDWDSSIIFSCFVRGVPIFEVEELYLRHRLFQLPQMRAYLAKALEHYAEREKDVDLRSGLYVVRQAARSKLFHSPRHPVDALLRLLLEELGGRLGLPPLPEDFALDGFAFNQWPVITRHHTLFAFPEQAYFVLGGRRVGLEDAAMAYYNFYEFNPRIVEANLGRVIEV